VRRLRVAIVCYPSCGGSGVVATELAGQLGRRGHEAHIVSYDEPFRLEPSQRNVLFHTVAVPSYPLFRYPPYLLALTNRLVEVVRQERIDIIHAHYAIPHAVSGLLAKQILGGRPPLVTTLHGTDVTLLGQSSSFREAIAFALRESDGLTAVSDSLCRVSQEEFSLFRGIRCIHNFIDPETYHRRPGRERSRALWCRPDEPLIVHVSNFRAIKQVPQVVRIFARIAAALPARLVLVGEGPDLSRVRGLARELGVAPRVTFAGLRSQVADILSVADLFLLPSLQESFGLSALEAMACEVPVIASRVGGLVEVVEDGVTGHLLDAGDVAGMAEAGIRLLQRPEAERREIGRRARRRAVQCFSAERIVPQYEQYFLEVLGEPVAARPSADAGCEEE